MLNEITKAFAEYQEKMNRLAVSLIAESNHLENVAKHCNECSRECHIVAKEINEYAEHYKQN